MVALDDLDELEPRCGERGERGREGRAEREVRHQHDARLRVVGHAALQRRDALGGPARGADERPGCRGRAPRRRCRARRPARSRRTTMSAPSIAVERVGGADRGVQLEIVGLGDQPLREGAHPARRADDGDPADHVLHLGGVAWLPCPATSRAPVDDPVAAELLDEYFASRALGFTGGEYRRADPDPAAFVPPAGDVPRRVRRRTTRAAGCGGVRMLTPRPRARSSTSGCATPTRGRGLGTHAAHRARGARDRSRRPRRGARHQRHPRGGQALYRTQRLRARSSRTTTTRTRRTGSARLAASSTRASVRLARPADPVRSSGRQVPEVVVGDEHRRLGRPHADDREPAVGLVECPATASAARRTPRARTSRSTKLCVMSRS